MFPLSFGILLFPILQFGSNIIGNLRKETYRVDDILFVVYTERIIIDENGKSAEAIRLISARLATSFERGVYYGKLS